MLKDRLDAVIEVIPEPLIVYDFEREETLIQNQAVNTKLLKYDDTLDDIIAAPRQDFDFEDSESEENGNRYMPLLTFIKGKNRQSSAKMLEETEDRALEHQRLSLKVGSDHLEMTVHKKKIKDPSSSIYVITFIDHTNVITQEEQRAFKKYQKLMLANVTHELKTPLGVITGSINEIERTKNLDGRVVDLLDRVKVSGQMMDSLISDILDLGSLGQGAFQLHSNEFQLSELLQKIEYVFSTQMEGKDIRLRCEMIPPSQDVTGIKLKADEKRLTQILINLVSNALKFTPRYGTITVVGSIKKGKYLQFDVIDTGYGISKKDQEKLFSVFGVGIDMFKREHNGSGLGLNICKQLIEKQGGEISFSTVMKKGTTFTFFIQPEEMEYRTLFETNEIPSTPSESKIQMVSAFELSDGSKKLKTEVIPKRRRIEVSMLEERSLEGDALIVDDNYFNVDVLQQIFHEIYPNVKLYSCFSGKEALDEIQRRKQKHEKEFNWMLLDINMPEMTGFELENRIRNSFPEY